jgi:hypothetical protein
MYKTISAEQRTRLAVFIRQDPQAVLISHLSGKRLEDLEQSELIATALIVAYRAGLTAERIQEAFVEPFGLDKEQVIECLRLALLAFAKLLECQQNN